VNQQFPIDNRAGAAGMIGAAITAKSPPDGYTIMVYSQTFINNMHLYPKKEVPFELKDFAAVAMLVRWVGMLTVHPSMPVRTTKEFIALAKARPGEILYGSAGIGAYQHLSMSVLASMSGIKATHVPFKGGGPAVVALVGGEIQSILTPIAEVYSHIQPGGRLRPIAVSSAARTSQFPNIPTIAETVKGYEFTSWFGCLAPAGTPKPIVDRLSAEIKKALAHPDVIAKLAPQVLDPMHLTPEEFTKHLQLEYDRMRDVVKLSGARIE
ncbi:MAG TPA: tripartite tricarboxylate transporter substrate-binding protein, partial [Burkholderiales bacterium]|nr:tripartite tricarboxylate transporter substrate-binding protein [Burkholderiales bacterium]